MLNREEHYKESGESKPRPRALLDAGDFVEEEVEWTFENSIWADYICDTEELLGKCFSFDWSSSDIPKYMKEQSNEKVTEVYNYLRT
jgi:hypothetical protein